MKYHTNWLSLVLFWNIVDKLLNPTTNKRRLVE